MKKRITLIVDDAHPCDWTAQYMLREGVIRGVTYESVEDIPEPIVQKFEVTITHGDHGVKTHSGVMQALVASTMGPTRIVEVREVKPPTGRGFAQP